MRNPDTEETRFVVEVLTGVYTLAAVRAAIELTADSTDDRDLKHFLDPVRAVLMKDFDGSEALSLTLSDPPFKALIDYCRRRA